jgi:hypothetical protein
MGPRHQTFGDNFCQIQSPEAVFALFPKYSKVSMIKIRLPNTTLLTVDCVNIDRMVDVSRICQRHIEFGDVKLLSSQRSSCDYVVHIPHVGSLIEYSLFMMKELTKYVQTSHVLIIQHDGFILNPYAWDDEFLQYDYIGAPWCYDDGLNVGNGGFSLRSKRLLDILSTDEHIVRSDTEDYRIGRTYRRRLERQGIRFAPEPLASRFSIEGNIKYGWKWNNQFGFHSYRATDLSNWKIFRNASVLSDTGFILTYLKHYFQQKYKQEHRQQKFAITNRKMIEVGKYFKEE